MSLQNRTALVTGSSSGVGKGIALELARAGCSVAVNSHMDSEGVARTIEDVRAFGVDAFAAMGDIGLSADVRRIFDGVLSRFSKLDILVNNAGVQSWSPLLELKEEDWDRDIRTNLKGCFLCMQTAARHMKKHAGGAIINIGSACNKVPFPRLIAYTASKGGIEMLTKVAAVELGSYGIRVNCVAPGAILVERTKAEGGDYGKIWGEATPLGRVGLPCDVGQAVVFLASSEASYISGQTIYVDGAAFTQAIWPYRAK
ncbi:MAG TPA: 3-oxoacyl-ACP reductase family protein [Candidatus Acidoferrales bacterium]|nr:3-oxoacyl-ACP reductase family protein [Candidatus Acidoferrales bacterium]